VAWWIGGDIMKKPWSRILIATVFGSAIALSCVAEAVVLKAILPW
jgi:hypothetical protein